MGACSIEGGNAGGIPDRQQRSRTSISIYLLIIHEPYHHHHHHYSISEYFDTDPAKQDQGQTQARAKPVAVEQQSSTLDNLQATHNSQAAPVQEIGFPFFPFTTSRALILL
jgi:hypothetical protein